MKFSFCFCCLLISGLTLQATDSFGQQDTTGVRSVDSIFTRVEIEASFPGGDEAWIHFLESNLRADTPIENGAPAGKYTVIVQFIVDKDGKISNIKSLSFHGYGMEKEVIRVLKLSPNWVPAYQDGRTVKAYRKQPVTFIVMDGRRRRGKSS